MVKQEDEMGKERSRNGEKRYSCRIFVGKSEGMTILG
jgi:hypothetical protein